MPRRLFDLVPAGLSARRRWNAEYARVILKQLAASGISVRECPTRQGIDAQRVYRWRAQLRSVAAAEENPAFVEIKPAGGRAIEVVLRSGHVVRVADGFAEETLRRVVAALDGTDHQITAQITAPRLMFEGEPEREFPTGRQASELRTGGR
jgi:transposase-like protein